MLVVWFALAIAGTIAGVWAGPPLWLAATVPAVALVAALWRLALIPRQVRAIGYAERDDDLLIRTGIFFQRTMAVPYGRMQYVDVQAGPLARKLRIAQTREAEKSLRRHPGVLGVAMQHNSVKDVFYTGIDLTMRKKTMHEVISPLLSNWKVPDSAPICALATGPARTVNRSSGAASLQGHCTEPISSR